MTPPPSRWQALDILRGLTIAFMLLNLNPGSWQHAYSPLVHATWEGWTFIDLVAPAFLFCIGVSLPISLRRRMEQGATRRALIRHILIRAVLLVAIGLFLNAYPDFDFAHMRIPGVLQRIGLCYGMAGALTVLTARSDGATNPRVLWAAFGVIVVSYFVLLHLVPGPGFSAPAYDPVNSWPTYVDRQVLTPAHMFPYWPVNGQIVFDPEGILSTWPACANVVFGVLVGAWYLGTRHASTSMEASQRAGFRVGTAIVGGVALMILATALHRFSPIIKNLWSPTFVLFTCGFSVGLLGVLTLVERSAVARRILFPATVFGSNALLAYMISFLIAPLIDATWFPAPYRSIRNGLYVWFEQAASPKLASLAVGVLLLALIWSLVFACFRRRWFLKL